MSQDSRERGGAAASVAAPPAAVPSLPVPSPSVNALPDDKAAVEGRAPGHALRALKSRNYRLYFTGQGISLIGSWMTRLALNWLVYRLTHSAWLLGLVGFVGQVPTFLLGPVAGVLVDRVEKRRLLVWTQALAMAQSLALAALTLSHRIDLTEILLLGAFQGVINAFDTPGRQSFVIQMVDKREDVPNAIALNSSMVNGARLLGPSLAGIVIAAVGEGGCFLIDGVSYIAVIASLLMMALAPSRAAAARGKDAAAPKVWEQIAEGWRYVVGSLPIRNVLMLLALVSLVGMPYTVLMPVFANKILHGGPKMLGLLMGATGIGALSGAIYLANRKSILGLGHLIPRMAALFGIGLILFSFSRSLYLSIPLLFVTGFGFMVQMASSNTLIQTIVEDDKRGRVMSFYTMAFLGTAPFGSLLAGVIAARAGAPQTVLLCGIGCLVGAVAFLRGLPALREALAPIYARLGLTGTAAH